MQGEVTVAHRLVTLSALCLDVQKSLQGCQKKKKKLHSPEMIGKWNFYLKKLLHVFAMGMKK